MKAIRLIKCTGSNPAFSKETAAAAKASGEEYNVPRIVTYEAGTECDHPEYWILCCLSEPKMRPADDECKKKVEAYLNHPARKTQLARLKQMAQPEVFKDLPKGLQEYVKTVAAKWLDEDVEESNETPGSDGDSPIDDETLGFFTNDKSDVEDEEAATA